MGLFSTTYVAGNTKVYDGDTITNVDNTMSPKAIAQSNKIRKAIIVDMLDECNVQDNSFNGMVVALEHSPAFDGHVCVHLKFTLNGKEYDNQENMATHEWKGLGNKKEYLIKQLHKFFIEVLSAKIVIDADLMNRV